MTFHIEYGYVLTNRSTDPTDFAAVWLMGANGEVRRGELIGSEDAPRRKEGQPSTAMRIALAIAKYEAKFFGCRIQRRHNPTDLRSSK